MATLKVKIEFGGGLELLFNNQRSHTVAIPARAAGATDAARPTDLAFLIHWLRTHLLTERAELFVEKDTVYVPPLVSSPHRNNTHN